MSRPETDLVAPRPPRWRRRVLLGGWAVAVSLVCLRAGQIQVLQASEWRAIAEDQHKMDRVVVASRGAVLDRDGLPLAVSRERFEVAVAYDQLTDAEAAQGVLKAALDLSDSRASQLTSGARSWAVAPGRYPPAVREKLQGVRGIHVERELQRYHPHGDLARGVLGTVLDNVGAGGVEQAFEGILAGTPGREVFARNVLGREIPGERITVEAPRTGGDVVLTLDMDLQEIARQALQEAIEETRARGGDVLVTDPQSGEILALVSIRDGQTAALSAVNTPYEPGSTLKPFTVAGLVTNGLASLWDSVDVGDGTWRIAGRTLHDVHSEGRMSLADALRVSSNVGVAKAAQVMPPAVQYENLRDFGFGVLTGVPIPGEVAGTLRRPDRWSGQSPASLAIGYEISVTPLQMAMAYGALANGGKLMQPRLVREIRHADGSVERFAPQVVRQVVKPEVASSVSRVLVDVVEDGTGSKAQLGTFRVAGKSGTSRLYSPEGGYEKGAYWSSFVGFFPAENPQLVVFVKLERPEGAYYGGAIAAPVTRATMEAALAARSTALDRSALVNSAGTRRPRWTRPVAQFASRPLDPPPPPAVSFEAEASAGVPESGALAGGMPLPDVAGLPSRTAVRRLHAVGLRVTRATRGEIVGTEPIAGTRVLPGDTIQLVVLRRNRHE